VSASVADILAAQRERADAEHQRHQALLEQALGHFVRAGLPASALATARDVLQRLLRDVIAGRF